MFQLEQHKHCEVSIGDDDTGFDPGLLDDFLGHYDAADRVVLNPAADSSGDQATGFGRVNVHWNPSAHTSTSTALQPP